MRIFKRKKRWGVEEENGLVYEPGFSKKAAERVVQLESSDSPPKDWEETREILEREGFTEDDWL